MFNATSLLRGSRTSSRLMPLAPGRTFTSAPRLASAVKPGADSEATVPGGGGTEDIANSSGAYEGDKTDPTTASHKIEQENKADFSTSATNPEMSEAATKQQHASDAKPSKQELGKPSRTDLGATEARKEHKKRS